MSKPQRTPLKRVLRTQLHLAPAHVLLLFLGCYGISVCVADYYVAVYKCGSAFGAADFLALRFAMA